MNIAVIGAGYVGLVTAAVFSHLGNKIYCVEISKEKINLIKKGLVPFYEPSLSQYIKESLENKRLFITDNYQDAIPNCDVVFICVGTPPKENGEADLSYLFDAVGKSAKNANKDTLIVIKSTIPVGFEAELEKISQKESKNEVEFAVCPEFLREGTAMEDSLNPDRIVIGTRSKKAQDLLLKIHKPLPGERIICDMRSAQIIKYASNAFLATKISFANAVANICNKTGADVSSVMRGVGLDKRIGAAFLKPGIGYGGSCLPKDVLAFIAQAQTFEYDFELLKAVDSTNQSQISIFVNKVLDVLEIKDRNGKSLSGKNIGVLGLAFKANTDDIRDSAALKVITKLLDLGASISAYDPQAIKNVEKNFKNIKLTSDPYEALNEKDLVLILTEWVQFIELDWEKVKKSMKNPIILDGRNLLDKAQMEKIGFDYFGIGR